MRVAEKTALQSRTTTAFLMNVLGAVWRGWAWGQESEQARNRVI